MPCTFEGVTVMTTARAILFHGNYWEDPQWMPRSQCEILRCWTTGETIITASDWICGQKGLREFEHREKEEEDDQRN